MRFILREIIGYALIAGGCAAFYGSYLFLASGRMIEGAVLAFSGWVLVRSGVFLQRTSLAARIVAEELRARRSTD